MQPYSLQYLIEQARRTETTRQFLFAQVEWNVGSVAVDLGCGPGTITDEVCNRIPHVAAVGVDIDPALLEAGMSGHRRQARLHFLLADAAYLPFRSSTVTVVFSHFVLMWIPNRTQALSEAQRILQHEGIIAAIEPDYGGRIEGPTRTDASISSSTPPIVKWLMAAGADPYTGSQLPTELRRLGLTSVRFGVLAWEYEPRTAQTETHGEAALLDSHGIQWTPPDFTFTPVFWLLATKP